MATASELLEQWVSSFNGSQWDVAKGLLAPNGVTEEIGTGRTTGVAESIQNAQGWRAAFPDAQGTVQNRMTSGNQAVAEIVWTGTNSGPLMGMPPTNKRVQVQAVAVVTEEGGKISRIRHYIDVAGMMAQLGVMPGAGAPR